MPVLSRLRTLAALLPLLVVGSLLTGLFTYWQIPAAAFLGYLAAGISFAVSGSRAQVPPLLFRCGQACLGLLIARWVTPESIAVLRHDWPLMLLGLGSTVLASVLIALGLIRFGRTPALAAAWGSAPGAASAMVAAADAHGADSRLVAILQYLRILAAIITASLVSHWLPASAADVTILAPAQANAPGLSAMLAALAVVVLGVWGGGKIANGANLIPLIIGVGLNAWHPGWLYIPSEAALLAFAAIGLHIGLRFDLATLRHIGRRLPVLACAVFSLTVLCGLFAGLLALLSGRDFATLYFALSPGGLDAMAIMALESGSPLPLVLAMQTLRIVLVVVLGSQFARLVLWLNGQRTPA
jgi:membrane AbrB-like protein